MMIRPPGLRAVPLLLVLAALACGGSESVGDAQQSVAIGISPTVVALDPRAQEAFTAEVTGTANLAVTWAVNEGAAGGAVTTSGAYTAPAAEGTYHVVVTSVADPTKSAVATVTVSATATTDLCAGLVQDKLAHPMSAVPKPAVGASFVDPEFGTTIRRVSDAAAQGATVAKPVYSTIQAFNADESYLILYHTGGTGTGHHLYDGRTYKYIKRLTGLSPPDLEQIYWSTTDPKIVYFVSSSTRRLMAYNVETMTSTVVHDFTTAPTSCTSSVTGGSDPMWSSWSPQVFGLNCGKLFAYNKDTDTVSAVVAGSQAPQPGPSGQLFLTSNAGVGEVRDFNMNLLRTLQNVSSSEHGVLGSANGVDHFFSVQFDTSPAGTLIASDLTTGARRVIIGTSNGYPYPPTGTHISGSAYKKPGWVSLTIVGNPNGQNLLSQEILLVNANDGGTICRVGHHHSCGSDGRCGTRGYWAEPHGSISPSGTRILFASDWGGEPVVETYVVELPSYVRAP